jgi:hypothetical protein
MLKKIQHYLKRLIKGEASLIDIYYYFQGHLRQNLFYSSYKYIIRKHIQEQLIWRLMQVKKHSQECYATAQCKHCGCDIPALTFSNKSCHGNCYPLMMSKYKWNEYKKEMLLMSDKEVKKSNSSKLPKKPKTDIPNG